MIKTMYYRGSIDFCNYKCSYCPFAKKKREEAKLEKDALSLKKLYTSIQEGTQKINLMITPYGEALFEEVYQKYIARLSTLDNINKIGIQTNFSLNASAFNTILKKEKAAIHKIMIWATYHGEFSVMQDFVQKVNTSNLNISVGIVANTQNYQEILTLRNMLKKDIYLWINAMDKKKNLFDKEKIENLRQIDPMFLYEFARHRDVANFHTCSSYNNLYVDSDTISSKCFFKKKKNIAQDCNNHKKCDCYLGYSNFFDTKLSNFFGENQVFRIPQKRKYKALFIDIDGVLTNKNATLLPNIKDILLELQSKVPLYIATARNFLSAKKLLKSHFQYFSGGVFSDGTACVDFKKHYTYIDSLSKEKEEALYKHWTTLKHTDNIHYKKDVINIPTMEHFFKNICLDCENMSNTSPQKKSMHQYDAMDEKLLRISLPRNKSKYIHTKDLEKRLYNAKCYLQNKNTTKLSGILKLMQINHLTKKDVLFISNNIQDKNVFETLPYTISVPDSKELSNLGFYSMNLEHIFMILE